jgi:hypothetical protein
VWGGELSEKLNLTPVTAAAVRNRYRTQPNRNCSVALHCSFLLITVTHRFTNVQLTNFPDKFEKSLQRLCNELSLQRSIRQAELGNISLQVLPVSEPQLKW